MLRCAVTGAGNDHRLGAQEAPPAIISLYTGELMEEHIRNIVKGGPLFGYLTEGDSLAFGSAALEAATRGLEDRNRTAPFPFCGNRFEFRAVRHALPSDRRSRRRVVVARCLSRERTPKR